ncbi:het domain-containing protein [Colletotrichum truncatum]|uniref:Het domain-containing protein n=1 Tax=Colletotrichum truncatum TaxID=5467 RepID=A0ACC3YZ23_COLTU|nr:uncharacterized protein CTRU02_11228 [Colletotrichum truncatum]KAF6786357.1 hypothetical protein CTRU02_11228 [Colletotrichum truncatum]
MRLINVITSKLEWKDDATVSPYAILSHTWGDTEDEITYHDIEPSLHKTGKGRDKFEGCRAQAMKDMHKYVWIDTCCIDKDSKTELDESINSMFAWYEEAQVCYAYLDDVPNKDDANFEERFSKSKWFTRGWTLQELLASERLIFYSQDWQPLGSKIDEELSPIIEKINVHDKRVRQTSE